MKKIDPKELNRNAIQMIGQQWMLVTSGQASHFNTMTASWGGMGFLWNKPVVFIFVRPERYTDEFIEEYQCFTLSFLGEGQRHALKVCGSQSGRDTDKVKDAGLIPLATEDGNVYFEGSEIVLECKTLYKDSMQAECFIDKNPLEKWYGEHEGALHKIYVAEIVQAWVQE